MASASRNGGNGGKPPLLTPAEVAELLLVSPITVRQWAQEGKLASKATPGGHRRFSLDDIRRFASERGMQLAGEADSAPRRRKVLVVDDDQAVNGFVRDLISLHDEDCEVFAAYDGFEAGMLVNEHKPDALILDVMMPGMDGFEVCRRLKENPETRHIRVIGMTGHYTPEIADRMLALGADICLAKPIDSAVLISALEKQDDTRQ